MNELKLITMKLYPESIQKVEMLKMKLALRNKADAVVYAVNIAKMIVDAISNGDTVIIERKKTGEREKVVID